MFQKIRSLSYVIMNLSGLLVFTFLDVELQENNLAPL